MVLAFCIHVNMGSGFSSAPHSEITSHRWRPAPAEGVGGEVVVVGEDTDPQLEFAAAGGGERGEIRSEHHLPAPIGVMQIFFFWGGYFFLPRVNGGFDKKELVQNNGRRRRQEGAPK